jgi:hypothetical protein
MSQDIARLKKKLEGVVEEAKMFFEEAAAEPISVRAIYGPSWAELSEKQREASDGLRRRLRQLLVSLTPALQGAPLLEKRDLVRFAKLGRIMDSALRFAAFRKSPRLVGLPATDVFHDAYREMGELLDLIPKETTSQLMGAAIGQFRESRANADHGLPEPRECHG